jgi:hypothetical protein
MKVDVRIAWEFPPQSRVVLASEYDALAQRCAEVEVDLAEQAALLKEVIEQRDFLDRLQSDECARREKAETERDALRAEVERLQSDTVAVPRELLERACTPRNVPGGYWAAMTAINDLRALLGKDGE